MAFSKATTVDEYLAELPEERREVIAKVRDVVIRNLPKGYRESMGYGMINYEIPLERYPVTYNKKPLCYAALAAQKNHYALYLMGAYADPAHVATLKAAFAKAGKKFDMGKSCLLFRNLDDLPLKAVGDIIAAVPPEDMIAYVEEARRR